MRIKQESRDAGRQISLLLHDVASSISILFGNIPAVMNGTEATLIFERPRRGRMRRLVAAAESENSVISLESAGSEVLASTRCRG